MDLKEGYPLYEILSKLNFNKNLIGYVYFAEKHGGLSEAFLDGSNMVLKREKDLKRLFRLLYYPLLLMSVTLFLFIFVERILLPKFTSLFQTMQLKMNFLQELYTFWVIPARLFSCFLLSFSLSPFLLLFVFPQNESASTKRIDCSSSTRRPRIQTSLYSLFFRSIQLSVNRRYFYF